MAERLYLVPIVGTGTELDARRPKYFDQPSASTKWPAIGGISTAQTWGEALRLVVERLQPGLIGKPIRMNGVQLFGCR